ncbi:hypothetical protein [Streptomyces sp. Ac-502]|uniref:hypothetical protein n=1 Tax=Streptomyces sp. Ac-502 TaxID=3342801 RepID=UPI0038628F9C
MATVHMSAAVQELLGPYGVAQARKEGQRAQCATCTKWISTKTVNVVVTPDPRDPETLRVFFVHPKCGASQVTTLVREAPENPTSDDFQMTVLPPPADGHRLPVLAAEQLCPTFVSQDATTELISVMSPYLQESGFGLVSDASSIPPPADQWTAVLDEPATDTGLLSVAGGRGEVLYAGPVHLPPGWSRTALAGGTVALYVGPAGLDPTSPDTAAQQRLLERAARSGQLLAARVPLVDYTTLAGSAGAS